MPRWILPTLLSFLLVISAVAVINSRLWLQETHRELQAAHKELNHLRDEEQALRIEWVSRTDLNAIERRARDTLGMTAPKPDQWQVVTP
ncbi:MAG: cell division protein FtsL [Magnetococcales bacterium]|nr:cell division protein FtsL [Magnetococcales bacterium]